MPTLQIRDWDRHFENCSSRKLKRLDWVAIPNKTDSEGYTALVEHPNAAAHLGAWYAIVAAASKSEPRGTLPRGIPADIGGICRSLGRISRLPSEVFAEVLPRLIDIGWVEWNQRSTTTSADSPDASADRGRERDASRARCSSLPCPVIPGGAGGAAAVPLLTQTEWPLTTAELIRHDPAVDQRFVLRLTNGTAQALISAGDMEPFDDEDMATAIKESYEGYHGKRAHGNGLLLSRVPQIMLNWGKDAKENGNG